MKRQAKPVIAVCSTTKGKMMEERTKNVLNVPSAGPDLARIAMPVIRVMAKGRLSWSDLEECADLLRSVCNKWDDIEKERLFHQNAAGERSPAGTMQQCVQLGDGTWTRNSVQK